MMCALSWYYKEHPGGPGGGTHSPRVPGSPATMNGMTATWRERKGPHCTPRRRAGKSACHPKYSILTSPFDFSCSNLSLMLWELHEMFSLLRDVKENFCK